MKEYMTLETNDLDNYGYHRTTRGISINGNMHALLADGWVVIASAIRPPHYPGDGTRYHFIMERTIPDYADSGGDRA